MEKSALPDIAAMTDVQIAARHLEKTMRATLAISGARLGTMAVVWVAVEDEGNSAGCVIVGDLNADALDHMADCLLNHEGDYETVALTPPTSN